MPSRSNAWSDNRTVLSAPLGVRDSEPIVVAGQIDVSCISGGEFSAVALPPSAHDTVRVRDDCTRHRKARRRPNPANSSPRTFVDRDRVGPPLAQQDLVRALCRDARQEFISTRIGAQPMDQPRISRFAPTRMSC